MRQTEAQVSELADALWQMLNDMHPGGQSVCLFAKAKARLAYEPFRDEPEAECGIMSLADAQAIVAEVDRIHAKPLSDRHAIGE